MGGYQGAICASQSEHIFFQPDFVRDSVLWNGTGSCRLCMLSVARPTKLGRNFWLLYKTPRRHTSGNYSVSSFKKHTTIDKRNCHFLYARKFFSRLFLCRTTNLRSATIRSLRRHPECEIALACTCAAQKNTRQCSPLSSHTRESMTKDRDCGLTMSNSGRSMKVLIALQRGLTMWIAASCVIWLACPRKSLAVVEASATGLHPSPKLQVVFASAWPKILLVLGVFRDHGLLLSALLGLSAFFSMAETSITTLWPWKVRELAEKEGEDGVFQLLRQDITRFLTTILIGTTVANIAATALVTDAATTLFGEAGVTAATGVMTVVLLLLTEIAPKSVAVHNATGVARFVVRPVAWLSIILYPVGRVVTVISTKMLKLLGFKTSGEPFVTEEEIKLMLRGAELSGSIEEEEQDMIENVLEIKDTYVREVMTPLVDVVAIDAAATLMDFRNLWVKHQYSRVPVFERRVDNIVGIAYAMDMLDYVEEVELLQKLAVGQIAHSPAYFVPDSMSVWNLLREFRIRKVHMAIVLNEYGGAVGVVTLEDVVEEIVGEIFDENDSKEEIRKKTGYVVRRADGVFDVDANTSIEDLAEALDVKVPEGPYYYETVSGFICEAFGYIPRTGESIRVTLRKSDTEDGADQREGESDHPEDRREKLKCYKIEILAGNARKVGSVRFERIESSQIKQGESVARNFTRIVKRGRKQQHALIGRSPENEERGDSKSDLCVPVPLEQEDLDAFGDKEGETLPLEQEEATANIIDISAKNEAAVIGTGGLTVTGSSQEWQLDTLPENKACGFETDDEVDCSTASAVGTLIEKWEQHDKHVERWRQRRRQQSVEAVAEVRRWQTADAKRLNID